MGIPIIRLFEFLKTNETEPNFWSISIKVSAIQTSYYIHHHYYHFMDKILEKFLQIFFGRRYFFREPRQEAILKLASGRQKYPRKVEGSQNNDFLVLYFLFCSVQQQLMQSD